MNGPIDVVEVLRRANPVPPGSIDERACPTAAALQASSPTRTSSVAIMPWNGSATHARPPWQKYAAAAAAVAAGVAALSLVPRDREEPVTTTPPASPFLGTWESTDIDDSFQVMEITPAGDGEHEVFVRDDSAQVCSGSSSTMTGTGRLGADGSLVIPQPLLVCDDGSTPAVVDGPPLEDQLADLTFVHAAQVDELLDSLGVVWRRLSADGEAAATTGARMWPQSSAEEAREAQRLADEGDPRASWQVDPQLAGQGDPYGAEIVTRFLREELGWDAFQLDPFLGYAVGEGTYGDVVFVRCAAGQTNTLYPDHPEAGDCAPTIDDRRYEAVRISLSQPALRAPRGIWVVFGWRTEGFTQAAPPSDAAVTALLEAFLGARVSGEGAEAHLDEEIPVLYATTTGAPYERFEIAAVDGPDWPAGDRVVTVRMFADGGGTVVEQVFVLTPDSTGRLRLDYGTDRSQAPTTENGQPVAQPYTFLDGEVSFVAFPPWDPSFAGWDHSPTATTLLLDNEYDEGFVVTADPRPVAEGCAPGPAPADAEDLARRIGSDPDLVATEPLTVTVAGVQALTMDLVVAEGASVCDDVAVPMALAGAAPDGWAGLRLEGGHRVRLYLLDVPGGSARTLAIAVYAPEGRFEQVVEAATPIVESVQLHPEGR